jgi:hypothetical protein
VLVLLSAELLRHCWRWWGTQGLTARLWHRVELPAAAAAVLLWLASAIVTTPRGCCRCS